MLTIITVTYNAAPAIVDTIESILQLKKENVEYLIIDGGSTDGTLDIIEKYENQIDYWVSEKDEGIYNAMNKGIKKAKGKYICFINAGDILIELPFQQLDQLQHSVLSFPVKLSSGAIFYPTINNNIKLRNTLPHQGCFYLNKPGLSYNEKYIVFADFDLNQNYYKQRKSIKVFENPIVASHNLDGISHDKKYSKEIFSVVKNNFGTKYLVYSWLYFKMQGLKLRLKLL
jgi:glycosyltransferase involved in cell wall biosynthesis